MGYQILVLDSDGTLTSRSKTTTPKAKMALVELQKQGKKMVLAGGRPTYDVLLLTKELELEICGGYILSYNGDITMGCKTGETAFSRCISVEYNAVVIRLTANQGVNILTYEGDKIITLNGTCPYVTKESAISKLGVEARADMESYVIFQVPRFLVLDDSDYLALMEAQVKAKLGKPFSIYCSEPYFLGTISRSIDKAQSLGRLLESIGLSRGQVVVCGNGYSDLTTIQYADLGVAMEDAILLLKQAAGYVTLSNSGDGIARMVEKLVLS